MASETERFGFGDNWQDFVTRRLDRDRIDTARAHLLDFLSRDRLDGLSVLDIGCGSGIHSLAAIEAGAASVHGFDYDPASVAASAEVRKIAGSPANWTIEQGSVLDAAYLAKLPQFDLVYSWGVLHHTGDVWSAIANAISLVKPGGRLYIALYSADVQINPPPEFWLAVKRRYNASGPVGRRLMEAWYIWRFMFHYNPFRLPYILHQARRHRTKRGMSMMVDIRDWLGGWPMEFVRDAEAISFCEKRGLALAKLKTGEANTEFLFSR